jgi:hypothetical protein
MYLKRYKTANSWVRTEAALTEAVHLAFAGHLSRNNRAYVIRISLETCHKLVLQPIELRCIVRGLAGRDL